MLTLCYASAGAGKTRSLVHTYLRRGLALGGDFRRIAAITFTNKAADEMKMRILDELGGLARGEGGLCEALQEDLGCGLDVLQDRAQKLYETMLQHYEAFTVTTIDGFFQGIVDGFRQELALPGDYEITLSVRRMLESTLQAFWRTLPERPALERALTEFAQYKIRHQRYWNITREMLQLGYDALLSHYAGAPGEGVDKEAFFARNAKKAAGFEQELVTMAVALRGCIAKRGYVPADFAWGERGILGFLRKIAEGQRVIMTARIRKGCTEVDAWATKRGRSPALIAFIENHCQPALAKIVAYYDEHVGFYSTIRALQRLYYALLTTDRLRVLFSEEAARRKKIPINTLPSLLQSIIDRYPIDFIYTHLGRHYDYFLIDEFQDVSRLQWCLIYPLIAHGISQGGGAFLVGDVKQAIYGWRGGDVSLFLHQVEDDIGKTGVCKYILPANWRSRGQIVAYNNAFFPLAARKITEHLTAETQTDWWDEAQANCLSQPTDAYAHSVQQVACGKTSEGYVEIVFHTRLHTKVWREMALQHMIDTVTGLAEEGYALGDIAILVRDRKEGETVVGALFATQKERQDSRYQPTFLGGFPIDQHPYITLLLHALRYLSEPEPDDLLLVTLVHHYQTHVVNDKGNNAGMHWRACVPMTPQVAREFLPTEFLNQAEALAKKPLYALVSLLINQFDLATKEAKPFLEAFQEALHTFTPKGGHINDFLVWWEREREDQRLNFGANADRINVMTVHQAKGLAFKVVLLPFADWSLNHPPHAAPILWATTQVAPFHHLGPVPVYYGKHLETTYYCDAYYKERVSVYLESLNLLYVATTRAKERLYLFAPYKEGLTTIGGLLSQILAKMTNKEGLAWKKKSSGELAWWQLGEKQPPSQRSAPRKVSASTSCYHEPSHHDMLLSEVESTHVAKGTWWHALLAKIETYQEIPSLLQQYVATQQLTPLEAKEIKETLMQWCADDPMRSWFSRDWHVKRERGLLLPNGKLLQPDRVMVRGQEVVVLDYKTGQPKEEHKEQVRTYAETLRGMGYAEVNAYLFYTTNNRLQPVV